MAKGRTKFFPVGEHPLLLHVRDLFIMSGLELVGTRQEADFILVGAGGTGLPVLPSLLSKPVFVLSSSIIYQGMNHKKEIEENKPISVHPLSDISGEVLYTFGTEVSCSKNKFMIIRIFDLYGKHAPESLLSRLMAGDGISPQERAQVRSYLYMEDFIKGVHALLNAFLQGVTGVYNLGASQAVSGDQLCQNMAQLTGLPVPNMIQDEPHWRPARLVPALFRIKSATGWIPKVSLRKGLHIYEA